jgi:Tol biopolymer transport system component
VLSPDGHWLAYASNTSGRFEVYVRPFPGGGQEKRVSIAGGSHPRWRRTDGKELFFLAPGGTVMACDVTHHAHAELEDLHRALKTRKGPKRRQQVSQQTAASSSKTCNQRAASHVSPVEASAGRRRVTLGT